jgi:hydrogenase expression/formation protein HypC
MCLAVPGRIIELNGVDAVIEIAGVRRASNVSFIENPQVGEYVLLHAGFAIEKWSEEDVREYEAIISGADLPEPIA